MALKDCVFLGLIAFSAIVFYLHGFYHGTQRSKKELESLLNSDSFTELPPPEVEMDSTSSVLLPARRNPSVNTQIHGLFGCN